MSDDLLTIGPRAIRATDTNSLLRLYDHAQAVCGGSPSQLDRERADRAIQRIGDELRKRNIALSAPPRATPARDPA
jgi:hypothetical protein